MLGFDKAKHDRSAEAGLDSLTSSHLSRLIKSAPDSGMQAGNYVDAQCGSTLI